MVTAAAADDALRGVTATGTEPAVTAVQAAAVVPPADEPSPSTHTSGHAPALVQQEQWQQQRQQPHAVRLPFLQRSLRATGVKHALWPGGDCSPGASQPPAQGPAAPPPAQQAAPQAAGQASAAEAGSGRMHRDQVAALVAATAYAHPCRLYCG